MLRLNGLYLLENSKKSMQDFSETQLRAYQLIKGNPFTEITDIRVSKRPKPTIKSNKSPL